MCQQADNRDDVRGEVTTNGDDVTAIETDEKLTEKNAGTWQDGDS